MTATMEETAVELMTIEAFLKILNATESMSSVTIPMDGTAGPVVFTLPPGWNVGLSDKDPQETTDATLQYADTNYVMTKEAILGTAHSFGLNPAYVTKTPGVLISSHLNYWATHSPDVALKFLVKDDKMLAVTKDSIKPFSNVELLETALEQVYDMFGIEDADTGIMVDVKSFHDLHTTNIRLVIPSITYSTELKDGKVEQWSPGIQIRNSLTGKFALSVSSYLYSWTTNSGVVMPSTEGRYNRKFNGQEMTDVLQWTEDACKHVLEVIDHEAEILSVLAIDDLQDAVGKVLADIFKTYKIPLKVRGDVMDYIIQTEDQTYYGVVNAVSQTANNAGLPEQFVTNVLEAAGEIAAHAHERCGSCKRAYL